MGVVGLMAFLWSMRSGQYEDLDGAAERVLLADAADAPFVSTGGKRGGSWGRPKGGKALTADGVSQGAERTEGSDNVSSW